MSLRVARIVSILGHPLLVLPLALLPAAVRARDPQALSSMAIGIAVFAALMLGWSWRQVRRGRWAHIDASHRGERRNLNLTLPAMLSIAAALAWYGLPEPGLAVALLFAAGIVTIAILVAGACTLSLHLAFAVYAAGLLWPMGAMAMAAGIVFAAAVGWSRLRLSRHEPRDLAAGALAGLLAAATYWPALAVLRG